MKKIIATLSVLFVLFLIKANAQFTYTRDVKDSALTVYPYDMIVTNADNCIVATTPPDYISTKGIYITTLNSKGNLVWSKNYTALKPYSIEGLKMIATEDNGFLAASTVIRTLGGLGSLVFKVDSNGNVMWTKKISPTLKKYTATSIGISYATDKSIYVLNELDSGISIQKLDQLGNPIWNRFLVISSDSLTLFAFATATTDGGLIISNTSSYNSDRKYYNHIFQISKDGVAEAEYTTSQASDDYIYGWAAKSGGNGKLNILFSQYGYYLYSILNLSTGQAETYYAGQSVFDIQSFLRTNNVNIFRGISFPYVSFQNSYLENVFTKNWSLMQTTMYHFTRLKTTARIQRYDSIGRICPSYQILDTQRLSEKVAFKFTKSSFQFSPSPVELNVIDTVLSVQNIDTITKVCAGVPPPVEHPFVTNNAANISSYIIKVFPNPTSAQINLLINANSIYASKMVITDLNGIVLKSNSLIISKGKNNIELNVDDLSAGIYILKLSTPDGLITQKIVKQ